MKRWIAIAAVVLLSEAAYVSLLTFEARAHIGRLMAVAFALFALYAAAIVMRGIDRRIILAVAVLFRLTLVPLGLAPGSNALAMMRDDLSGRVEHFRANLLLDDDAWRYLWDGHISARGENPYGAAPIARSLEHEASLWRDVRRNVNHADLPTIYPPVSQLVFFLAHALAPGSLVALKLVLVVCDLLNIIILIGCLRRLGRPLNDVLLYAWNPLVILMFAGAAHIDVVMLLLLSLAMYFLLGGSKRAAGVALGLATMAKLAPFVVWPFFIRRMGKSGTATLLATTAVSAAPFLALSGGGLQTFHLFVSTWDFNSAGFEVLRHAARPFTLNPDAYARVISVALLVVIIFWMDRSDRTQPIGEFPGAPMNALGALLMLSPTVMPWYATWPLGFAVLARHRALWFSFSALVCLSFPMTADWTTHAGWLTAEYAGLAAIALIRSLSDFSERSNA